MPPMPQPTLLFEIEAECTAPVELGILDGGTARMIPITGGRVSGPRLSGTVLPGADWSVVRKAADGAVLATVDARYALQADDGTIIQIFNGATCAMAAPRADGVAMITTPRFIAPDGPHGWLNHGTYAATLIPNIGEAASGDFAVKIGVFALT